jgi:triacylglycerol lipase
MKAFRLMTPIPILLAGAGLFGASLQRGAARPEVGGVPPSKAQYVVLLHGLGRTPLAMKRLEWALSKEGYCVLNLSYPSTRISVQQAAECYLGPALRKLKPDPQAKIHFVTHSLGGIVLRCYLRDHPLPNLGRVVMLAPPNQGSELADRLKHNVLYRYFMGPAGQQLGTEPNGLPKQLGSVSFQLGVIAGDRSWNPWFSAWIPGPDDGKVSVQSTRLLNMRDFLVVHHSHTWMMWRRDVVAAVLRFLSRGSFRQ